MIPKIHRAGRSFRDLLKYLTHDAGHAETSDRIAWTHTINLAHDDVGSAVDEMLWTFRAADQLKRAAGISTGGPKLEKPVRHFSLSWHESECPTREHMIETVESFLKHLGWHDRQAVILSHTDKRFPHVHVVLNSVSPEDGRSVRNAYDWRRSQAFGLQYELEQGRVFCEERLKPAHERERSSTRPAWEVEHKVQTKHERHESERDARQPDYFQHGDLKTASEKELNALHEHHKKERADFLAEGKEIYRQQAKATSQEVAEEFRSQWNALYEAKRLGADPTWAKAHKMRLKEEQRQARERQIEAACDTVREQRDVEYQHLQKHQADQLRFLLDRQSRGLRSPHVFDMIYRGPQRHADRATAEWRAWESYGRPSGTKTNRPADVERNDSGQSKDREWKELKAHQRHQRESFIEGGSDVYRAVARKISREVRESYREAWRDIFDEQRAGADASWIAEQRKQLAERQNKERDEKVKAAFEELKKTRDQTQKDTLRRQQEQRQELRDRQQRGLAGPRLLDIMYPGARDSRAGPAEPPNQKARRRDGVEIVETGGSPPRIRGDRMEGNAETAERKVALTRATEKRTRDRDDAVEKLQAYWRSTRGSRWRGWD
jgi:hypothetical protein